MVTAKGLSIKMEDKKNQKITVEANGVVMKLNAKTKHLKYRHQIRFISKENKLFWMLIKSS